MRPSIFNERSHLLLVAHVRARRIPLRLRHGCHLGRRKNNSGVVGTDPGTSRYVLILYAVIVVVDGFLLQPYIMCRVAKVPMWASILAPLVLGFLIPFWGFLLAPPLLAVGYAYKARRATRKTG